MRTLEVLRNIAFAALVAGCSPLIHGQVPASSSPPLAEAKAEDETPPIRYQPGIKPPTVIYETRPDYTQEARNKKFSGNVQVYLWVETDGTPSHVQVKRPVGMGLDEKAVECIRKYRFKPAKLDGKPVKFELYIDVAFNPRFANP